MDVFFCMHDFIIMNKLCAALIPEKMKIATIGLSVVKSTCVYMRTQAHGRLERGAANASNKTSYIHNMSFRWCHCVFLR